MENRKSPAFHFRLNLSIGGIHRANHRDPGRASLLSRLRDTRRTCQYACLHLELRIAGAGAIVLGAKSRVEHVFASRISPFLG